MERSIVEICDGSQPLTTARGPTGRIREKVSRSACLKTFFASAKTVSMRYLMIHLKMTELNL